MQRAVRDIIENFNGEITDNLEIYEAIYEVREKKLTVIFNKFASEDILNFACDFFSKKFSNTLVKVISEDRENEKSKEDNAEEKQANKEIIEEIKDKTEQSGEKVEGESEQEKEKEKTVEEWKGSEKESEIFAKEESEEENIEIKDKARESEEKKDEAEQDIITENIEELEDNCEEISFSEMCRRNEEKWAMEAIENINKKEEVVPKKSKIFKPVKSAVIPISSLYDEEKRGEVVAVKGKIYGLDYRETANNILSKFFITDNETSFTVKKWLKPEECEEFKGIIHEGSVVIIEGKTEYDSFMNCPVLNVYKINESNFQERSDNAEIKRVELNLHTNMSAMDGISTIEEYLETAKKWGMTAIAITDTDVVQAFPDAQIKAGELGIKMIYGIEMTVFDDKTPVLWNIKGDIPDTFTIFDIETSGLTPYNAEIIEIGAVKIKNGEIIGSFSELIKPEKNISNFTTELTGITNALLSDKPLVEEILPKFMEFIENTVLVGHNVKFDTGFIRYYAEKLGFEFNYPILDTLSFARNLHPDFSKHTLDFLCKNFGVSLKNHHRAVDDALATKDIFLYMMEELKKRGEDINNISSDIKESKQRGEKFTILVKNQTGLKNLYKLISMSNLEYYMAKRGARIPLSILEEYREGLIIGSSDYNGALFEAIRSYQSEEDILKIANLCDYIEIQPIAVMQEAKGRDDSMNDEVLRIIREKTLEIARKTGKIAVATGDVHYIESYQNILRKIIDFNNKPHKKYKVYPDLKFRTTEEMLEDLKELGDEKAYELAVINTNKIADEIEEVIPVPDGTFPPRVEGSDEEIRETAWKRAKELYGEELPEIVRERLDRELNAIIDNGYSIMYLIARRLVKQANEDGYLVGSRGSVGSSFAATMVGITEVNPLSPHYRCSKCKYSDFESGKDYDSGVDLPDKTCPKCGVKMIKDGHNIPFEVFMGFNGDKEPDIDLNFAGEYQPKAHKLTEELFGKGNVFRAGTISTVADKIAMGYVMGYYEKALEKSLPYSEKIRLAQGITGVKRTTGQHPGGIMVVPDYKDIYDFTPVQHPADKQDIETITTHFDYHKISGRILKLDILGHDVPSMIKQLEDMTGADPLKVPLDDKETMKLFSSLEPLGLKEEDLGISAGTLGIPEFGTKFVLGVLRDTKPQTFADLVRISGLSHGTDVWAGNAKDLIEAKVIPFNQVIATREDIMLRLIKYGLPNKTSFDVMEKVRKGKWKKVSPEVIEEMKEKKVPDWYITSLSKIQYMFPKAHAVAYVMMSFRIAYYKINYPEEFYSTIFSTKVQQFKSDYVEWSVEDMENEKKRINELGKKATANDAGTLTVLELMIEMLKRGFKFKNVSLYESEAKKFTLDKNKNLIPPFTSVDGLGEGVAFAIVKEREIKPFMSIEELKKRTGITQSSLDKLEALGTLKGMQRTDQLDMFSMMEGED